MSSSTFNAAKSFTADQVAKGQNALNAIFPPKKRADTKAKLQAYAQENPKLAAFLLCNTALTGLPLLMFTTFILTVFVFSFVATLLLTTFIALGFAFFMAGLALLILLPTLFVTTMGASFVFSFGLAAYYLYRWLKDGKADYIPGASAEKDVKREKSVFLHGEGQALAKQ